MIGLRALTLTLVIACSVAACSGSQPSPAGSDGAAVAACRSSLSNVADDRTLATTVRNEGSGYVINAWTDGRAEGIPDYVCNVVRDEQAARGVAVGRDQALTRTVGGSGEPYGTRGP